MRKEGVRQDDFGSHVKVLRKVSAGARSRSRHVRPLGRVFAHFRVFAFREKSVSAPARAARYCTNARRSKKTYARVRKRNGFRAHPLLQN
jgi:hypothetical protein